MENNVTLISPTQFYILRKDEEANNLIRQLRERKLAAILGESGAGKTTFAKITLPKALQGGKISGAQGSEWRVVYTAPLSDPIENLARDLGTATPNGLFQPGQQEEISRRTDYATLLREHSNPLGVVYDSVLRQTETPFNLLLVVDQLEDLIRYQKAYQETGVAGDDVLYVNTLLSAMRSNYPIYILLLSDPHFLSAFSRYRGLSESMYNNRFYLSLIEPAALKEALEDQLPLQINQRPYDKTRLVAKLTDDYTQLLGKDHTGCFALEKIRLLFQNGTHTLRIGSRTPDPADLLQEFSRTNVLESVIPALMHEQILRQIPPQQSAWTPVVFKALTEKTAEGRVRRTASFRTLANLIAAFNQGQPPGMDELRKFLSHFNQNGVTLLRMSGRTELSPNTIVSLDKDVLLYNWPELIEWVNEEAAHGETYRLLVRKASQFFSAQLSDAEKTAFLDADIVSIDQQAANSAIGWKDLIPGAAAAPEINVKNQYLSEGAELSGGLDWQEQCRPGEVWAQTYNYPDFNADRLNSPQFNTFFPKTTPAQVTQLQLVLKFLEISKKRSDSLSGQLRRETAAAQKQKKIARIMAAVAVGALLISLFFMRRAVLERRKLELIDFVGVLINNNVLEIPTSRRYFERRNISQKISFNSNINTPYKVLDFLVAEKKLLMGPAYPFREASYEAMINMDEVFHHQASESAQKANLESFKSLYDYFDKNTSDTSRYWQHPALFYNLLARITDLEEINRNDDQSLNTRASILEAALVSNPHVRGQFAFGDQNGKVYLQNDRATTYLGNVGSSVMCTAYSSDGNSLLVGTEAGTICRFSHLDLAAGRSNTQAFEVIYKDPKEREIYFIQPFEQYHKWFICAKFDLLFLESATGAGPLTASGNSLPILQGRFSFCDISDDQRWFLVAGNDSTTVFSLHPANAQNPVRRNGHILHPQSSVTDFALRFDTTAAGIITRLALGSEVGDVWIGSSTETLLGRDEISVDEPIFRYFKGAHELTITCMEFNPTLPQLASAGMEGQVRLWNLRNLDQNDDHIRLRRAGQSITAAVYNNADELVIYEVISGYTVKTNVKALRSELDCYLNNRQKCLNNGY